MAYVLGSTESCDRRGWAPGAHSCPVGNLCPANGAWAGVPHALVLTPPKRPQRAFGHMPLIALSRSSPFVQNAPKTGFGEGLTWL